MKVSKQAKYGNHTVVRMKLADLSPAPYNPRKIAPRALSGLQASVRRFGCVEFPVWNKRTSRLVAGHQRVKVMAAEGVVDTDVVVVDLCEADEKALNVALNNHAIQGEFTDALEVLLAEIGDEAPDLYDDLLMSELSSLAPPTQADVKIKQLSTKPPPAITWALVGIPTVRFGEIADIIQRLGEVEGIILETTSNDG